MASFATITKKDLHIIGRRMLHNFSGMFVSLGQDPPLPWCGMLEFALLSVCALDPRVDRIEACPERVSVMLKGKRISRIPAFRMHCGSIRIVVDATAFPQPMEITEALRRAYESKGECYRVFSRAEVEAQPRLRNARLVLGFRRYRPDPDTELAVLRTLSLPGTHTVRSLLVALPGHQGVRETVYSLCTRRRAALDLWAHDPADMIARLLPAERWLP